MNKLEQGAQYVLLTTGVKEHIITLEIFASPDHLRAKEVGWGISIKNNIGETQTIAEGFFKPKRLGFWHRVWIRFKQGLLS